MTFGEMKHEVFQRLAELGVAEDFFSEEDVEDALNEALIELSDASEWYERTQTLNLLADRTYYDMRSAMGDRFLALKAVLNNETNRWCDMSVPRFFDSQTARQWEIARYASDHVFMRGLWWLGVFGLPTGDNASLRVSFAALPPELVLDTDRLDIPTELNLALVEYALYDLLIQDGETGLAMIQWDEFGVEQGKFDKFVDGRTQIDTLHMMQYEGGEIPLWDYQLVDGI